MSASKALYVVAAIAAIFSIVASMFAAASYRVAAHNFEIAKALTPNPAVVAPTIEAQSAQTENLLRMLSAQHGELQSVHGALLRVVSDQKSGAWQYCLAWIAMSIVLSWLTIRLKPTRTLRKLE